MATLYKLAAGAALVTNTNWTQNSDLTANPPPVAPGAADTAVWQPGSLGASLTGSISPSGILVNGAASDIAHSGGTITLGSGGLDMATANNKRWYESGTITASVSQTWNLYTTANSTFFHSSATAISGAAGVTLSIQNPLGSGLPQASSIILDAANTGFSGILELGALTGIGSNLAASGGFASATVTISGSGAVFWSGNTVARYLRFAALNINASMDLGLSGATTRVLDVSASGAITLSAGAKVLTVYSPTTISTSISGAGGITKAEAGTLTLDTSNTYTGNTRVDAGTLRVRALGLQNSTLDWSGTVGTLTFLDASATIANISGDQPLNAGATTLTVGGANANATFSGALSGSGLVTKSGTGIWTLSGNNASQTGGFTITAGTLSAQNAGAIGSSSTGAVTVSGTGCLDIAGSVTVNKASITPSLGSTGNPALSSTSGTNTLSVAGITLNTANTRISVTGTKLTISNTAAITGGGFGIEKLGAGELQLANVANTYSGTTTVTAGTLTFSGSITSGAAGTFGQAASAVPLTGTLKYAGTTAGSVNRSITFTGASPALEAAGTGTGAITYSACSQAAGARTITFKGAAAVALQNTLSAQLSDGTGAVSVVKEGACTWVLSNATVNYTGTTLVSAGVLNLGATNRVLSGAVTVSGGTLSSNSSATLSATGGLTVNNAASSVTLPLTGAGALTVSAGTVSGQVGSSGTLTLSGGTISGNVTAPTTINASGGTVTGTISSVGATVTATAGTTTLQPTANANTYTGTTAINGAAIVRVITTVDPATAGAGKVLGDSDVTITGQLKTSSAGAQNGKMRYGGDLAFASGGKLFIGGA